LNETNEKNLNRKRVEREREEVYSKGFCNRNKLQKKVEKILRDCAR
jgi:hypothetical protein